MLLAGLAGCGGSSSGGGGGGGGGSPPTISLAAFVGTGATPVADDKLILFLDRDVELVSGALLDDADLSISAGTLGTVTAAPTLLNSRAVEITLGNGVNLAPGTATISFGPSNDAVRTANNGPLGEGGTPRTLTKGDGDQPTVDFITLNDIPGDLNGTGTAGGTLQAPRTGIVIQVDWTDSTTAIAPAETIVAADKAVATPGGNRDAGQNLADQMTLTTSGSALSGRLTYAVPSGFVFPVGDVTLSVTVADQTGMVSAAKTYAVKFRDLTDAVRPFEKTQVWWLDLSRDVEAYTYSSGNPTLPIQVVNGPNSVPDFDELMRLVGLFGADPSINSTVRTKIQDALTTELGTMFSGVDISWTFTQPATFPGPSSVPYGSFGHSQICIAGAEATTGTSGVLGVAIYDENNESQDNNCLTAFQGNQRLGVFLHTLINHGFRLSSLAVFKQTYTPLASDLGGTPIGQQTGDAGRLSGSTNDSRTTQINTAIARMARATAVITAHEVGHSVGLVPDGAMPTGLYGGDPTNFPGSSSGHIRNDSLFPTNAQNIMSPGISFDAALEAATAFNALNLSYLRETAIYDN